MAYVTTLDVGSGRERFQKSCFNQQQRGWNAFLRNCATLQMPPVSRPRKNGQNPFRLNYADFFSIGLRDLLLLAGDRLVRRSVYSHVCCGQIWASRLFRFACRLADSATYLAYLHTYGITRSEIWQAKSEDSAEIQVAWVTYGQ